MSLVDPCIVYNGDIYETSPQTCVTGRHGVNVAGAPRLYPPPGEPFARCCKCHVANRHMKQPGFRPPTRRLHLTRSSGSACGLDRL